MGKESESTGGDVVHIKGANATLALGALKTRKQTRIKNIEFAWFCWAQNHRE
jgi:hypothetical protein